MMNPHSVSTSMWAYTAEAPNTLSRRKIPAPRPPGVGEVTLDVLACSICGTDHTHLSGRMTHFPHVPCHEGYGRVIARGPGVSVPLGALVTYLGLGDYDLLAEKRNVRLQLPGEDSPGTLLDERLFLDSKAAAATVLEPDIDPRVAVLIEPVSSVARACAIVPPPPGGRWCVLGGGVAGTSAHAIATLHGAESVMVLEIDPTRRDLLTSAGARAYHPLDPYLARQAREHSGNVVDYVFDCLPSHPGPPGPLRTRQIAADLLGPGRTWCLYSAADHTASLPAMSILAKGLHVRGVGFDERVMPMRATSAIVTQTARLLTAGVLPLTRLVTHTVSFWDEDAVRQAFAEHGQAERLKTMIVMDSPGPSRPAGRARLPRSSHAPVNRGDRKSHGEWQ